MKTALFFFFSFITKDKVKENVYVNRKSTNHCINISYQFVRFMDYHRIPLHSITASLRRVHMNNRGANDVELVTVTLFRHSRP